MFSGATIEEIARVDSALMDELAASIPGGKQIMIQGTGHNVHVDKPEVLIAPVREMIEAVQRKRRD
jgi:pimeloyl-ACP methyl ester carboxylesterase